MSILASTGYAVLFCLRLSDADNTGTSESISSSSQETAKHRTRAREDDPTNPPQSPTKVFKHSNPLDDKIHH